MNKLGFIAKIIFAISLLFILKALELFFKNKYLVRDGDGTGIYFYGFEINDKVPYGQIPFYLWLFLVIGTLLLIFSVVIFILAKRRKEY